MIGAVGVLRALRVGGGARRVEEPAHRCVAGSARAVRRRQRGGSPSGSALSHDEHLERAPPLSAAMSLGHAPRSRSCATPRARRAAGRPPGGCRSRPPARGRSGASGSAPRRAGRGAATSTIDSSHVGSCHDTTSPAPIAEAGEPGRGPLGRSVVLGEGHVAALLVDAHEVVGRQCGPLLDQLPQTARLEHAGPPGRFLTGRQLKRASSGEGEDAAVELAVVHVVERLLDVVEGVGWRSPARRA